MEHPIRAAMLAGDLDAVGRCLADDVTFLAAASDRPFHGRGEVLWLLGNVLEVSHGLEYVHESRDGNRMALGFRLRLPGGTEVEGLELVTLDAEDRFLEARLHARPFAAVAELGAVVGPRLAARRGRLAAAGARGGGVAIARAAALSDRAVQRML